MLEKGRMGIHRIEIEGSHTLKEGFCAIGFWRMLGTEESILEVVFQKGKCLFLQIENRMHEQMQPAACAVTAAGHTAGLLLGRQEELVKLAVPGRLNAPHMAGHRNHATARRERMLVPGEMEPTGSGCTQ